LERKGIAFSHPPDKVVDVRGTGAVRLIWNAGEFDRGSDALSVATKCPIPNSSGENTSELTLNLSVYFDTEVQVEVQPEHIAALVSCGAALDLDFMPFTEFEREWRWRGIISVELEHSNGVLEKLHTSKSLDLGRAISRALTRLPNQVPPEAIIRCAVSASGGSPIGDVSSRLLAQLLEFGLPVVVTVSVPPQSAPERS